MSDAQQPAGWPDPDKPGVPLNPERDGWHWLENAIGTQRLWWWYARDCKWENGSLFTAPGVLLCYKYLGPILTPAEVDAIKADLTHWQECSHAFEFDLQSARADAKRLREALEHAEAAMEGMASDQLTAVETANLWNATMESIRTALEEKL